VVPLGREADPAAFERSEALLVEAARVHGVTELGRVLAFWRARVERERGPEGLRARRDLHASVTFGGMVRVDGDLDPETGESLLSALRVVLDAEVRSGGTHGSGEDRRPAQRRADALGEICRQFGWTGASDRWSRASGRT